MSNLKYKVGDVFDEIYKGVMYGSFKIVDLTNNGYLIEFDSVNERDKNVTTGWIDEFYNQVINFKVNINEMNIEENKHHQLWEGMQSIDVMKAVLTHEEYIGFLKGNIIKYQLRLGKKDNLTKEKQKINDYTNELNKALNEKNNNKT